ncbi:MULTISPECIES: N-acetyl sugar amidotransferase [Olivibacter]|uniref:N-acetyl sugar amidotransferase n=1 Tax=Olivibacter jilunii TaxID=985016 RepID=A0ABW6B7E9_9SPHI|nr:N-acetyl sugar amidotransferase [Olivibacter sp. UJ_SKK_5.1]MDX3912653.1 N-acetyl sugar amidotransferase [Pseudosphingobacterium sp.]
MMTICSRCIYDDRIPHITFNNDGVCNYCIQVEQLNEQYQPGNEVGMQALQHLIEKIKNEGKGKKYDCIIGVSGGTDSSYLLCRAKEWGLRPLAVHYDNTWNTAISTENIRKICAYCDVDLYTYVIDNKEADDIFRAFFFSGVPEFDASTDIAFAQVLRDACAKFNIKYVLEGHSYAAEGISPQGNNYFDGKYIEDIHHKYGTRKMRTYPNMTFFKFLKSILFNKVEFIRPLWYLNYSKEEAIKWLTENTGWQYYGGHHLENRATGFLHTVYNPQKFGIDNRNWSLAAAVRSGKMSRDEALAIYNTPIVPDPELVNYVKKRLGVSDAEYDSVMKGVRRSWKEFRTYKKRFEKWRPFFYIMAKKHRVTMSFYLKYCFPR